MVVVREGDVLGLVLDRLLDSPDYERALRAVDSVVGARRIRASDTIRVFLQDGKLTRLDYTRGFTTRKFAFGDSGFTVSVLTPDFHRQVEFVQGAVETSLYFAFDDIGERDALLVQYADIFGWDIDFTTETQEGDSFFVLVEKNYLADTLACYGRVLWARYRGRTTGQKDAYYYRGEYYDAAGLSLRKAFLKSPLKVYRISSGYSGSRYHPILKVYRPHKGVDYSAPAGTPVHALGEGVVTFAGVKGGYGKYVRIRHPGGFETGYGHLSRIAVSGGQSVSQGQVIGYVGMTGLATGPHLHFEMFKGGSFVNPLTVVLPPAEPVAKEDMEEFSAWVALLDEYVQSARKESAARAVGP